ncbi:MAG TPA: hypothetical protein V6C84_11970 [Coleofasciculaceae cyanobacterium]
MSSFELDHLNQVKPFSLSNLNRSPSQFTHYYPPSDRAYQDDGYSQIEAEIASVIGSHQPVEVY